ncbi:unnamed protein product [Pseudo-nitzschia multistriata]|uniref:Uncharacterized protein n=1 Tax=Pseudo-nitzschia multistriata TaxID=183589 RepID=A0A448YXY6_9STRA|nr:unnamed protein product [Pseudo-nitzschia multistriata]
MNHDGPASNGTNERDHVAGGVERSEDSGASAAHPEREAVPSEEDTPGAAGDGSLDEPAPRKPGAADGPPPGESNPPGGRPGGASDEKPPVAAANGADADRGDEANNDDDDENENNDENNDDDGDNGRRLIGKKVRTAFGPGTVLDYRRRDGVYVVRVPNGDAGGSATLYTPQAPDPEPESPPEAASQLNVAYQALEKMRRLNLDVRCHELGIPSHEIDHEMCTACLLIQRGATKSHFPRLQKLVDSAHSVDVQEQFPRLHGLFHSSATAPTPNDEELREQFPIIHGLFGSVSSSASSRGLASRVSASLQAGAARAGASATDGSDASNGNEEATEHGASAAAGHAKNPTAASEEAAAAPAAHPPPPDRRETTGGPSKSFPRIRKLWGSIQSLPQPAGIQAPPAPVAAGPTGGAGPRPPAPPASAAKGPASGGPGLSSSSNSMSSSGASFPRIRGLLNSSVTTSIFGDNQVKEDGSAADPGILIKGIGSSQASIDSGRPTPTKSDKPIALPRIQRLINKRTQANTNPCLICASPSCPSHSSASFRKEGITLCLKCERLFELEFIVDCVSQSDPVKRSESIDYMIDCYDRCMLLLKYSKQFAKHIAASLEDQKGKQDKIGLASSSVGVLSGVLGIAAAASILTPAGPPLLIASLFFGGGATTVQTGTEAINYFSEPRKLADRITALHGMALSILRVTSTLRDAMLRDHIRTDVYEAEPGSAHLRNQVMESYEKNKNAVVIGSNVGRSLTLGGLAGAEAGAVGAVAAGAAGEMTVVGTAAAGASAAGAGASAAAGAGAAGARGATAFSRAGTAAARTVRFARFAGGALSAAVLVMEANAIHSTLKSINDGSQCDKADRLRQVLAEIDSFPSTEELDDECQAYLNAMKARPRPPVEVAVASDDSARNDEIPEAECQEVGHELCAPGVVIVDAANPGAEEVELPAAVPVPVPPVRSSLLGGSSLFQRIQSRREERQSLASSVADEVVAVAVDDARSEEASFSLIL